MATNLPTGSLLSVLDNEGEVRVFVIDGRVNKGRADTVYAGQFVDADDDSPSILVIDNEDGTGILA